MGCEGLPLAVPESIHEDLVVLDRYWADGRTQIKGTSLEHDTVLVVDTSAFWEDQQGCRVGSLDVLLHPLGYDEAIFHLHVNDRS